MAGGLGGDRDRDLDRSERRAEQREHEHQRAHAARAQGAGRAVRAVGALRPPRARGGVAGEGEHAADQQRGARQRRRGGAPGADRAGDHDRPDDVGGLERGGLERERGVHAAGLVAEQGRPERAQARTERREGAAGERGQRDRRRDRDPVGQQREADDRRRRDQRRGEEHGGLPAAVHEPAEQRPRDAVGQRPCARHGAARGERAGQLAGAQDQHEPERRRGQPPGHRRQEQRREPRHAQQLGDRGALVGGDGHGPRSLRTALPGAPRIRARSESDEPYDLVA